MKRESPVIEVDFEHVAVINFSMQQNHVPVIRRLYVRNKTENDLADVRIEIIAEPSFAVAWTRHYDILPALQNLDLGLIDLTLSTSYLSGLTEAISGMFSVKVTGQDTEYFNEPYPVDILAYDQWSGISILPEILSAFITPNHAEIPGIIRRASAILARWTGNPSFDEYQSKHPDRVKKQMAAIYEAIAEKQIIYCAAPASFEETGQRIRILDNLFTHQAGNCLDLSLLFASCLEAIGINPIIVIIKGHAFAGAWLVNDSFPDSINDDPSLLTKRMADGINEIVAVEATCMNAGNTATFDEAIRNAERHLGREDDFILFLDVKRSRFSGIRPLPLRIKTSTGWEVVEEVKKERSNEAPREIVTSGKLTDVSHIDVSKQQMWERKLLDLSLRNSLINIRISKNTVQLISTDPNMLEDRLAAGDEFQVLPRPADWDNPLRSAGVYQALNSSDPVADLVKQELSQKRLRCYLPEQDLAGSLLSLYRSSRLSLEENGANTLYIALGLLKWYETGQSERPRFAPILLLPVEIIRKTAQKAFIIRSTEEDAIMNITLLEMIRLDFGITIGGLETLPRDEHGVDVRSVFNTIRQAIMAQSRWDVEEQVFLGTFSFSKFIMWNDIHSNTAQLSRNKVVASLIAGEMTWSPVHAPNDDTTPDRKYHPSEVALPISADSSQLEAICAAAAQESFVLHGPPGTGKSQTIANIIADSLYRGKKVLFVAEKMAALNVVQHRLEAIGLGPFCLELHSNKARKSAVLQQLQDTIDVTRRAAPLHFSAEAERLHLLRTELNAYVAALHKKYAFGYSLYDIFQGYTQVMAAPDAVNFDDHSVGSLSAQQVTIWDDAVAELKKIGSICGHPHNHPLQGVRMMQYTQSLKNEARTVLASYLEALSVFRKNAKTLLEKLKIDIALNTDQQFRQLQIVCLLLKTLPDVPANLVGADNIEKICASLNEIAAHGQKRDELRAKLLAGYSKVILSFNAADTLSAWNAAADKWFLPRMLRQGTIKKSLKLMSVKRQMDGNEVPILLDSVISYQEEQEVIDNDAQFLSGLLGFLWKAGNCDWTGLSVICERLVKLNREATALFESTGKTKQWRDNMSRELSDGSDAFIAVYGNYINDYNNSYGEVYEKEKRLRELLGIDFTSLKPLSGNLADSNEQHARSWLEHIESLRDWVTYTQTRDKAIAAGLAPLVTAYERGALASSEITTAYKKGLLRSCADYIFSRERALSSFNGQLFEEKIRRFREISRYFEQLTREELFAKLASRIPAAAQEAAQSSEMGILRRAIRNGGRGMSIRRLFDSISNLLPRLCPCMLMSPISVAQYFDADTTKFDLVIFDEASQMPTCEAVGAIARATNVVVVGDPKQMPPTNFFSANHVEEDNEKEDLESILDDCLALSMPARHLKWHYRSRHESLIAFSNARYYDNRLLTFPSPDDLAGKVTHVHVEGYYDRSGTRQNPAEAKAIVAEVLRRLADPELAKKSLGIVTFSSVQQQLIDDMLTDAFKANPSLESVALQSAEPLFIKNLENVQGDERDIILFSVGYGPDRQGKVNLNFGPLNREGGSRRLNVAVSRARYEMKVFSTLRADQVDITRTSSEGVADLRAFLEYAEKGRNTLGNRNISAQPADEFARMLAAQIRAIGYVVNTSIGCSGYRIDIGIVDPERPEKYILGILCDGEKYHEAKTARDREIVQYEVLRSLGWNIHRVWSADWWEDPARVLKGIITTIEKNEQGTTDDTDGDIPPGHPGGDTPNGRSELVLNNYAPPVSAHLTEVIENKAVVEYEICRLFKTQAPDGFLLNANHDRICTQIVYVVNTEGPISRSLLCRRVLAAWGITRVGARINAHFETLFSTLRLKRTKTDDGRTFFWNNSQDPATYALYRVPAKDDEKRDAEDLPPEEIANAVKAVLASQVSLPKADLIKEAARVFGYTRIGSGVEEFFAKGISIVLANGYAIEEKNRIVLKA